MSVLMYTKTYCPYCDMAKNLLATYNVIPQEINVEHDLDAFAELCKRTKMRTVPQIFINEQLIGGYDQLYQLHQEAQLKDLLTTQSS